MSNPEHQIKKALTKLIFDHAFYGHLAMSRLTILPEPSLKFGMATDGINLFYSPTWIMDSPDWETESVVAHEVIHCANGHPWRREFRDPKLWNIACDHIVNLMLLEEMNSRTPFKLWKGAYADTKYKGWSAEEVYADLLRQPQGQDKQQEQSCGDGTPQDGSGSPDEPEDQDEDENAAGDDAGTSDGDSDEDQNPQPGAMIDPQVGQIDPDSLQAEWTVAVFQAAQAAQAMGQLPAGMRQLVKEMRQPTVDWKSILRRFVQTCAKQDYSWRFPNRRYTFSGLYLPALQSESMPPVVIHWDTSGSRDYDDARKECAGEVTSIIEECKPERTHVMYCDTQIADDGVEVFEPGDPIEFHPVGGGGTAIKAVFDRIERDDIQPACMISITDLDIYDLDSIETPDFPVIWLKIGGYRKSAPFGEVVEVEPEHRHGY